MKQIFLIFSLGLTTLSPIVQAQVITPDMSSLEKWKIYNRTAESISAEGKNTIKISEAPLDGLAIVNNVAFSEGSIEADIKGRNVLQRSFIGIAFHILNEKTYEAIYFRPFNFMNPDTARRHRAVQYISHPDHPWDKLRASFPGKYEHRIIPVPDADQWFHAKIVVDGKHITVFVNNSTVACLEVESLTDRKSGGVALWVGNESDGSFANLRINPKK